ncbi:MAG: hypothetical protein AAF847_09360 [Bacteroidota bacterium]
MEPNKYNDRLEEIFSKRLNAEEFESNAWNTPPERSWEAIEATLGTQRRGGKRILILLLLLASFALMIAFLLFGNEYFGKGETKNNLSTQASLQVTSDALIIQEESKNEQPTATESQDIIEASSTVITSNDNIVPPTTAKASPKPSQSPNQRTLILAEPENKNTENEALTTSVNSSSNLQSTTETSDVVTSMKEDFVDAEIIQSSYTLFNTEQSEAIKPPATKKIAVQASKKWNVEAHLGAFSSAKSYDIQDGEIHLDILPTQSIDLGLNAEYVINKNWIIGTGFHYLAKQFEADYDLHFEYAATGEVQTQDGYAKAYTSKIPSLLSDLDAEIVLLRSEAVNLDTGSDIPVEVELSHGMQFLQIPVYVKFVQHLNAWSYYLKTGLTANIVVQDLSTSHMRTFASHEAIDHHSSNFTAADTEGLEQREVSYRLFSAVGVQYQLDSDWYLFAEPTFSAELRPIYPNKAVEENLLNFGGGIGVGKRF